MPDFNIYRFWKKRIKEMGKYERANLFYISNASLLYRFFCILCIFLTLYNIITIPYFSIVEEQWNIIVFFINIPVDIGTFCMLLLQFVRQPPFSKKIRKHKRQYRSTLPKRMRAWGAYRLTIVIYIICLIPLDYILLNPLWRLPKIFQLYHIPHYFRVLENTTSSQTTHIYFQLGKVLFYLIIIANFLSCLWYRSMERTVTRYAFNAVVPAETNFIFVRDIFFFRTSPPTSFKKFRKFVSSTYFTIAYLSGFTSPAPEDTISAVLGIFFVLVGFTLLVLLIGIIRSSLTSMHRRKRRFNAKWEKIDLFFNFRNVNPALRYRVKQHYLQLENTHYDKEHDIIRQNFSLKHDIYLNIFRVNFSNNALLKRVNNPYFHVQFMSSLKSNAMYDGDVVLNKGEVIHFVYFITSGFVRIYNPSTKLDTSILGPGDTFGERSLLYQSRIHSTHRYVAVGSQVEIMLISVTTFKHIINEFLEDCKAMMKSIEKRTKSRFANSFINRLAEYRVAKKKRMSDMLKLRSPDPNSRPGRFFQKLSHVAGVRQNNENSPTIELDYSILNKIHQNDEELDDIEDMDDDEVSAHYQEFVQTLTERTPFSTPASQLSPYRVSLHTATTPDSAPSSPSSSTYYRRSRINQVAPSSTTE